MATLRARSRPTAAIGRPPSPGPARPRLQRAGTSARPRPPGFLARSGAAPALSLKLRARRLWPLLARARGCEGSVPQPLLGHGSQEEAVAGPRSLPAGPETSPEPCEARGGSEEHLCSGTAALGRSGAGGAEGPSVCSAGPPGGRGRLRSVSLKRTLVCLRRALDLKTNKQKRTSKSPPKPHPNAAKPCRWTILRSCLLRTRR